MRHRQKDWADNHPAMYKHFSEKNVKPAGKDAPGLQNVELVKGGCADKHVANFLDCFRCWLERVQGEKPYRLHKLDLSRNNLSDESMVRLLDELCTQEGGFGCYG